MNDMTEQLNNSNKKEKIIDCFLEQLRTEGNVCLAARQTCQKLKLHSLSRTTLYSWKNSDPHFAEEWEEIISEGKEIVADLAEQGLRKLISAGNITAIIFTLKSLRPRLWGEKAGSEEVSNCHHMPVSRELEDSIEEISHLLKEKKNPENGGVNGSSK